MFLDGGDDHQFLRFRYRPRLPVLGGESHVPVPPLVSAPDCDVVVLPDFRSEFRVPGTRPTVREHGEGRHRENQDVVQPEVDEVSDEATEQ